MQKDRLKALKGKNLQKSSIRGNFPALPEKPNQKNVNTQNNKNSKLSNHNKIKPNVTFAEATSPSSSGDNHQTELISQLLLTIDSLRKQLEEMSKRQEKYEQALLGRVVGSTSFRA